MRTIHRHRIRFRDYLLAKRFGYTHTEILEQPAEWLDWMLAIDGKVREVESGDS
jgi:hypothetical protein